MILVSTTNIGVFPVLQLLTVFGAGVSLILRQVRHDTLLHDTLLHFGFTHPYPALPQTRLHHFCFTTMAHQTLLIIAEKRNHHHHYSSGWEQPRE